MLRAPSQKGFVFEEVFCRFLPEIMGAKEFLDGHELVFVDGSDLDRDVRLQTGNLQ